MSVFTLTTTQPNGLLKHYFLKVSGKIKELIVEHQKEKLIRKTANQLHMLSDRDLEDIGISRFEIDTEARNAVGR